MSKVQIKRGRGRPNVFGNAIVSYIKSKPWNGRVVGLGDIHQTYSRERAARGKLGDLKTETRCANIQVQNMLRAGTLVRVERGKYTIPAALETIKQRKAKAPKATEDKAE